jgi:peroxiredoxin-like protein
MEKKFSYQAAAHWTNHKRGIVEADATIPRTINFAAPPEFGGEPGLWTPEHLLLAAVSTCFVATFRAVAEASKMEIDGLEVPVEGTIEKQEGGFRFTKIILRPTLTIVREEDRERAGRLLEKAERVCLVSRSILATMVVEAKIKVEAAVGAGA